MGLMERLNEIVKVLPDKELAEVVSFAEALKTRHGDASITLPDTAIDVELMRVVRSRCMGKFTWQREELYDRGLR
jgi:hypothetical protein